MLNRLQFRLDKLFWLVLVVAAYFSGAEWSQRRWPAEKQNLKIAAEISRRAAEQVSQEYLDVQTALGEQAQAENGANEEWVKLVAEFRRRQPRINQILRDAKLPGDAKERLSVEQPSADLDLLTRGRL